MHIEWKRRLTILGVAAGVFIGYRYLLPVAAPFLAAWFLAELLYPAAVRIEKKMKIKRSFAGACLVTLIFAGAAVLLYIGISELLAQIKTAIAHIPAFLQWGNLLLDKCCSFLEETTGILKADSRNFIRSQADVLCAQLLKSVGPANVGKLFAWTKGLFVLVSAVVVAYISSILILGDMENLRKKFRDYSWAVGVRRVAKRLKKTTVTYLKAQVLIMLMVAAVCTAGFWLMGSPYFLILGLVLGALDALPLIGTGTFLYPAAVFFLLKGNPSVAAGCVALDIFTSVLREFAEPRLVGGKLGISPIAVLASVYTGVFLFGGWGFVLGPLSFSTAYEIGREWDVWD